MGRLTTDETDLETVKSVLTDPKHNVVLVVRLESCNDLKKRHMVIVSAPSSSQSKQLTETYSVPVKTSSQSPSKGQDLEYCLIGVDSIYTRNDEDGEELVSVNIGFVLKMLWGTKISLDGDGGFSVRQLGKHFIFKPRSVQALWTVIQTLHLISGKLKPKRNSLCVVDTGWVAGYQKNIKSSQSCINEWNIMPDLLVRRAPSPDQLSRLTSNEIDQETKKTLIKSTLREIMKTVNLDEITSKCIRIRLEEELNQKLDSLKAFIDEEILLILGQMDPASKVFDFLYLGSEWNASNLEELNSNGVTHILNVTREIDNFFPSVFQYMNIREYDVEETNLLKYWDKTFFFIKDCMLQGGKVLVHCKMGISRSASTVAAFAMKYFDWTMVETLEHLVRVRSIVDPNKGFRQQLQVYEGILEASKKRITFRKQRSKSESHVPGEGRDQTRERRRVLVKKKISLQPLQTFILRVPSENSLDNTCDKEDLINQETKDRPKSWSPSGSFLSSSDDSSELSSSGATVVEKSPIICHCYTQLSQHFKENNAFPSYIRGYSRALSITQLEAEKEMNQDTALVEATNLQVELSEFESSSCPARSHINQCTCHVELELKVSEKPVDMDECIRNEETDLILKNLGNFPIHIRQTQHWNNIVFRDGKSVYSSDGVYETENEIFKENTNIGLDTSGAEELSVKTLADMFDFKLGEEPAKPPLTSRHNKLVESKIEKIAKKLTVSDHSEC
ncbi:protein phosphatase Slingshot homolog 2 [Eurytemora carolleeae]|uniref:protein phosphatase Slingshot homolog 2 n=1 Tax=Eurytemora carolleeae TaxID=1294199 RepID=UPI000C772800|nr:protein phosphatase Slingshot homolog 2 [Eurytemora carolleeae]|eukprot:XP_023321112.1 protein phosphatase Slingshot homolog 2-like [Eurytemora affinis]